MESPHPDERPLKKRRFFSEDSSPAQIRTKRSVSPAHSPPSVTTSTADIPVGNNGTENGGDSDAFDVEMLQAVVGELPVDTLHKLKDVSGSDVQRG